jgi:Zn-dependent protease
LSFWTRPISKLLLGQTYMPAFNAFSLWGIRVRIDQSWFIAFLLFTWTLSTGYFPLQAPDYSRLTYWVFGTISTLALFGSVLVHELGHCLTARHFGVPVRRITLFVFGGLSEMAQTHSSSPGVEFRTTIAGPLSSIGVGAFFGLLATLTQETAPRILGETFNYLYYVNFLLAAFNLIPGFPLDGGRILRSYLWRRHGDLRKATRTAARIGSVFALALVAFGLYSLLAMHIVAGIWLLVIGVFLRKSAEKERRAFELRIGLEGLTVGQIMSPAAAVDVSMLVADFVNNYVFHFHDRMFPVTEQGRFLGMIDVRSIKRIPTNEWSSVRIGGYLCDPSDYRVLDPDLEASEALRVIVNGNQTHAPIVRNSVLIGMLSRGDLFKLISVRSDMAA